MSTYQVLFLCTGNYYRSRYAELLFNALVAQTTLPWRADSRGLALDAGVRNFGAISPYTLRALAARGIDAKPTMRYATPLREADLQQAHRVIALKEAEHRPLMQRKFPHWSEHIEYWHVHDIDCAAPHEALPQIDTLVTSLLAQLDGTPPTG